MQAPKDAGDYAESLVTTSLRMYEAMLNYLNQGPSTTLRDATWNAMNDWLRAYRSWQQIGDDSFQRAYTARQQQLTEARGALSRLSALAGRAAKGDIAALFPELVNAIDAPPAGRGGE